MNSFLPSQILKIFNGIPTFKNTFARTKTDVMMKKCLVVILLSLPFIGYGQNENSTQIDNWPKFQAAPYEKNKVEGHDFSVTISDMPDTNFVIGYHQGGKTYIRTTVKSNSKGTAVIQGEETWEGGVYLVAVEGVSLFEFVYSGTEKGFSLVTNSKTSIADMKIKNSKENELFIGYQRERIKRGKVSQRLNDRYTKNKEANNEDSLKVIRKIANKAGDALHDYQLKLADDNPTTMVALIINLMREPEVPAPPVAKGDTPIDTALWQYIYYKKHFWDHVDFRDDRILRTPIIRDRVGKYIGPKLTVQMPDSICPSAMALIDKARASNKEVYKNVLTWILSKYENSNIMGMNAVVVCLGQKYYINDPEVDWLKEKQRKKFTEFLAKEGNVIVGKKAKELVMVDYEGVPRSLHSINSDYTVAYFYSSTCGHCKKVTPKMKKIFDDYKDKGLNVYAVNTDYKEVKNDEGETINMVESKEYRNYVEELKLDWINVADPLNQSGFRTFYNIYSTPVIYLLDKEKKFIGIRLDWYTLRRMLLHEIDGMKHEDIEKWMKDNGFVPDKKEEGEDGEEKPETDH